MSASERFTTSYSCLEQPDPVFPKVVMGQNKDRETVDWYAGSFFPAESLIKLCAVHRRALQRSAAVFLKI